MNPYSISMIHTQLNKSCITLYQIIIVGLYNFKNKILIHIY